jgi:hypothetical protein
MLVLLFLCLGVIPHGSFTTDAAKICRSTSIPFHTWVQMDFSCAQATNCGSRTPFTQWRDIGYENGKGGSLRDESTNPGGVYRCSSWFVGELQGRVAQAASARQERSAIAALVNAGWSTAQYGLISGGLTSITCNPTTWSWLPRNGRNNVCWTFTCAYSTYLYQVLGVRPRVNDKYEVTIRNQAEIPREWTCKPEQYGTADGCQCNCGAFDPDCNPFEAVSLDCPNRDDICIPGLQNEPICALRHHVLSERKLLQIQAGVAVHHPQFYFSNDTDIDGAHGDATPFFMVLKMDVIANVARGTPIVTLRHIPDKEYSIATPVIMRFNVLCPKLHRRNRFVCMTVWLLLLPLKQDTLIQTLQARMFLRHQLSLRMSVRRLELSLL